MKSIVDESHRIANELEHRANERCAKEIAESEAGRKAYVNACEDFARRIRELVGEQDDRTENMNGNCSKCGAEISSTWMFCPDCGRRIVKEGAG